MHRWMLHYALWKYQKLKASERSLFQYKVQVNVSMKCLAWINRLNDELMMIILAEAFVDTIFFGLAPALSSVLRPNVCVFCAVCFITKCQPSQLFIFRNIFVIFNDKTDVDDVWAFSLLELTSIKIRSPTNHFVSVSKLPFHYDYLIGALTQLIYLFDQLTASVIQWIYQNLIIHSQFALLFLLLRVFPSQT